MKAIIKLTPTFLAIIVLILSSCDNKGNQKKEENKTDNILVKEMEQMMAEMNKMNHTKDADKDFVVMMKMHHEGAIKMAEYELNNGKDEQILSMARAIKDAQQSEIAEFDKFLATHSPDTASNNDFMMEMMHSMKKMDEETKAQKVTGEADHDFVLLMIPHHQSAVEMAQSIIKYGKSPEIKEMAQKIITAQQKEIEEMQSWLQEHKH